MFFKRVFVFILICFFPFMLHAETNASDHLKQILGNLHSVQAQFTQTISDANGSVIQQTSGVMDLQRPGLFRWETAKPEKQLLIADGKKVWFYDVELEQVTVQKQSNINENSPAMLLSGSDQQLLEDFIIEMKRINNADVFILKPKAENNLFESVELTFQNNSLEKMRLFDNLNQITEINFSQVKTNTSLKPSLFHFSKPFGVDVVNEA